jgi:hypothetical protein
MRAADMLSNLATLPSPLKQRSPFFICAVGISIIINTATTLTLCSSSPREDPVAARIQLGIGVLKMLGEAWPLAGILKEQMLDMYRQATQHR